MFTVGDMTVAQSEALTDQVRGQLARAHDFDPDDARALRVRNNLEQFQQVNQMFEWIGAFVWVVGVGTVLAGAVGVSNILLVSVKERTAELGLRKAIGATPGSLVAMILQEAVVLTSVAGYAGLVLGVALVEIVAASLPENEYVRDPSVDLGVLGAAVVLLVVLGTLAGLVPALRAASIDPINALRDG
jgi:putative ABC transport system permease protein